jgi:PilZ domain
MEIPNKTKSGKGSAASGSAGGKRSCPRYPFSPEVEVIELHSDTRLRARLSDIGRNGCYADTINPFPKDSDVTLTITRDKLSFKTHAKVVFSNWGMGMGLLFTTAEPDQLQVLGRWLSELSGEKAAERTAAAPPPQLEPGASADPEMRTIIAELIALLNGKNVLNDSEAMAFLRKLSK